MSLDRLKADTEHAVNQADDTGSVHHGITRSLGTRYSKLGDEDRRAYLVWLDRKMTEFIVALEVRPARTYKIILDNTCNREANMKAVLNGDGAQ